jgi:hypothetical protein
MTRNSGISPTNVAPDSSNPDWDKWKSKWKRAWKESLVLIVSIVIFMLILLLALGIRRITFLPTSAALPGQFDVARTRTLIKQLSQSERPMPSQAKWKARQDLLNLFKAAQEKFP